MESPVITLHHGLPDTALVSTGYHIQAVLQHSQCTVSSSMWSTHGELQRYWTVRYTKDKTIPTMLGMLLFPQSEWLKGLATGNLLLAVWHVFPPSVTGPIKG